MITLCGPPEFLPEVAAKLAPGLHITRTVEDAIRGVDVIMLLRGQKERLAGSKISLQDYITCYYVTLARVELGKKEARLMHPGSVIRRLVVSRVVARCPPSASVMEGSK